MSDDIKVNEIPGMFEGPVRPVLLKLAIPMFAGMVVQVVYNVTDTFWVARIDLADPSFMGGTAIVFSADILFHGPRKRSDSRSKLACRTCNR